MKTIGIIGAGEVGSQIARAAVRSGYTVVIANSRGPETLAALIAELGPSARAAAASVAARAGDFVVIAVPLKQVNDMPVAALAGKIVLDTNNYMAWRDGCFPEVEAGRKTVHELRQEQLPTSKIAKAFTHIQAPRLFILAKPSGAPDRHALSVSSNYPEASNSFGGCTTSLVLLPSTTALWTSHGVAVPASPRGWHTNTKPVPS